MKRKGRKSKNAENSSNGINDPEDQNGEASDRDEQDSEQEEKRNKRGSKRKSGAKRAETPVDDEESEPEEKKKRGGKRKSIPKKAEEEGEAQYEVEQVLEEKYIQGVRHFLIRWKGYEPESDTWEPESTLNCPELIAEFKAKKQKNKGRPKKKDKKAKKDAPEVTWDENEDFEVDRILDVYFKKNGQREFLVSWKGYPPSQNSWEPEENMDCKDLIKKFMEKVEKAKQSDTRELRVNRTHTDRLTLHDPATGRRLSKRNFGRQRVHYHDAE